MSQNKQQTSQLHQASERGLKKKIHELETELYYRMEEITNKTHAMPLADHVMGIKPTTKTREVGSNTVKVAEVPQIVETVSLPTVINFPSRSCRIVCLIFRELMEGINA